MAEVLSIDDFLSNQQAPKGASTQPLDTGEGKRPYMDIDTWLSSKDTEPKISESTVEEVTKKPVGRPAAPASETPTQEPQDPATSAYMAMYPQAQMDGAFVGIDNDATRAAREAQVARKITDQPLTWEAATRHEVAAEFAREEGLPIVGGIIGTMLAPATGGMSLPMATAVTAGAAGAGAFVGEVTEQTLKYEDIMETGVTETKPRDAWDILGRSTGRGVEEAVFNFVPDVLVRGVTQGARRVILTGAKPAEDVTGNTVNLGKEAMLDTMKDYAERKGLELDSVLLTSDIAEQGLLNAAENVASNSYITGRIPFINPRSIKEIRGVQEEALKEAIQTQVGTYMDPAAGYVKSLDTDHAVHSYIKETFTQMNEFSVAGLIKVGFTNAQEARKSVARSMYRAIGERMEQTEMVSIYKEIELPILGPNGVPLTTMQQTVQEKIAFPVNLKNVRKIAEDRADVLARTNAKLDTSIADLMALPAEADFTAVSDRLILMKSESADLAKSTVEGASNKKRLLDNAIREMEISLDDAAKRATEAGITGPNGESIYDVKRAADGIWKEQVEDFQNTYIANILKETNPLNGAPEKLGRMFIQNETAARDLMKVLDDAKGSLKGAELESILQAENAIKGSIVEELFIPRDTITGKFVAPDVSSLVSKEKQLRRIFGDESYDELRKLGAALEQQSGKGTSNYLGFAQRARESGMVLTSLRGLMNADLKPIIRDGGSTILFALGAGRLLTSPQMIRQARMLADPTLDEATKTRVAQWLIHRTYEYQKAIQDTLNQEELERQEAKREDQQEVQRYYNGKY